MLFAYSGVESVGIAVERIRDSVYGVPACAAMYMLSTVAIFGTVAHNALVNSTAPFADAINNIPVYLWLKAGRGEYGPSAKSPAKTSE